MSSIAAPTASELGRRDQRADGRAAQARSDARRGVARIVLLASLVVGVLAAGGHLGEAWVGRSVSGLAPSGGRVALSSAGTPSRTSTSALAPSSTTGRLLVEPQDGFGSVYAFVRSAHHRVLVVMYELNDATFEQALVADARRGVVVRVLLDKAYSGGRYNAAAYAWLRAHGVAVRWTEASTIVHEKAIVVDDRLLVATFNLADSSNWYATTRDFGWFDPVARDAAAVASVFASDWTGTVQPATTSENGADLLWSPGSEPALAALVASARHEILVESEELSDARMVAALAAAARRGVAVTVVMNDESSWRAAFSTLAAAGAHVYEHPADSGLYTHAKVLVVDPESARPALFLGSENLSPTSLDDNRELGVVLHVPALARTVAATVRTDARGATLWR